MTSNRSGHHFARLFLRALAGLALTLLVVVVLIAGALYGALYHERGTRLAWQTATRLSGGRLTGTFDGGTLAGGVRLHDVRWHSAGTGGHSGVIGAGKRGVAGSLASSTDTADTSGPADTAGAAADDATEIRIDRLDSRWALTRKPWLFTIQYLRLGRLDVRLAPAVPSSASAPTPLPAELHLPLQLDIHELSADTIALHTGTTTTEFSGLLLTGKSDGRHHVLDLQRLTTPYGAASASLALDGDRPFKLVGQAGFAGQFKDNSVKLGATLGGSLEQLTADLDAGGAKLAARAHVEATPFAAVPLKSVTLTADHLDPRVFSAGAPHADLSVRADLRPLPAALPPALPPVSPPAETNAASGGSGVSRANGLGAATGASGTSSIGTTSGAGGASAASEAGAISGLTVAGTVAVVNADPGLIAQQKLPLIDAHADVRLDAQTQAISDLRVRLVKATTITGGGTLRGGQGQFDLRVAKLDLNSLQPALRTTSLSGPVVVKLAGARQTVTVDLADPGAALRLQAATILEPAQVSIESVKIGVGTGRLDLSGVLKHDEKSSYTLKTTLTGFDPLALLTRPTRKMAPGGSISSMPRAAGGPIGPARQPASIGRSAQASGGRAAQASITGTASASGTLGPILTTDTRFALRDSLYDGFPLTGAGRLRLAGRRLLPSDAQLSIAGNEIELHGSFGAPQDRLRFSVAAPYLEQLGFGLAGTLNGDGDITGSLAHPNATLDYKADSVVFGAYRVAHAEGHAMLRDGANGALSFTTDARDVAAPGVSLTTLSAHLAGTRAKHTLQVNARGLVQGRSLDATVAAQGGLTETAAGTGWNGTLGTLENRGMPALHLGAPVAVSVAPRRLTLGAARLTLEGTVIDLKSLAYDHGRVRSAGSATDIDVHRLLQISQEITGTPAPVRTDLIFDADWNFALADTASGHVRIARRSGDVSVAAGIGSAALGITALSARAEFSGGNRIEATVQASAARLGTFDAAVQVPLAMRDGALTIVGEAPLTGTISANLPSLKTTGGLLGPNYVLGGQVALKLAVAGKVDKPVLSGTLQGNQLAATLVDQGVQLTDGVVRIALSENLVDFQQVEFHGTSGVLRATGQVRLDRADADLHAEIVADKLELFAAPDRELSLTGAAQVANAGAAGGLSIKGKFRVDHALFDMPPTAAPQLGDDVVVVRPDGTVPIAADDALPSGEKPVGRFAPRADIDIDLGGNFRFRGVGADLGLRGTINAVSAPNQPLRAVGDVQVTQGSTYTSFGRKLAIENGFFTFNGPVDNPGINILAMRRNQEVEAGVQVTGTVQSPTARLISEPNVADNEKISWLLFGHGTDEGANSGQQSTMTAALALLGNAGSKRIAQSIGLDEFSIGQSDVGLTDPQVVTVSKALNERLVLGYEQGLTAAGNVFKATVNLSRFWAVTVYTGTLNGIDLLFNRRFDGGKRPPR